MNKKRPNILFVMTDQERVDIGDPRHPCQTPNLNKLQREGVTFSHAFTPMTHCCPARASLMTGMMPSKHGVFNNVQNDAAFTRRLNPGCETFSQKLKDAGYKLSYTGKWHVSAEEDPKDCGWEELDLICTGTYAGRDADNYRHIPKAEDTTPRLDGQLIQPGYPRCQLYKPSDGSIEDHFDYKFAQCAIEKLKEYTTQDEPWCLFTSFVGPHAPFNVPAPYNTMYNPDDVQLPENYSDEMLDKPQIYQIMRKKYSQYSAREVRESIAQYWGYCTMEDDLVGMVLDTLEQSGQVDNTLVIRISDHGEFCGSHGLYAKGLAAFDESYRIPCVMRWPDGIKNPGRVVDEIVNLCDISPTVTEVAAAEPTVDPSGVSLLQFLRNETPEQWRDAFFSQCNGVEVYYTQRMVRTKKYKLVYNATDVEELYDLEQDPHEMTNIAMQPDMAAIKKELYIKLWENADKEGDYMSSYHTISHASFGPGVALGKD